MSSGQRQTLFARANTAVAAAARRLGLRVLDQVIFRELLGPFFFGLVAFLCILLGIEALPDLIKLMVRENFTLGEIGRVFACRLPKMIAFTFPMSTLLAGVLGYNRLSGDGEVTAMLGGGISFFRIEVIGVAFATVVAVLTYWLSESVVPRAEATAEHVVLAGKYRNAVKNDVFFRMPSRGPLRSVVMAKEFDYNEGKMTGVRIFEVNAEGEPVAAYTAEEAVWQEYRWKLHRVRFAIGPFSGTTAEVKTLDPIEEAPDLREVAGRRRQPSEMNKQELRRYIQDWWQKQVQPLQSGGEGETTGTLTEALRRWRDLTIQYHLRIAMPVSCIAFALVGIPLGIRPRRASSSMSFGLAVLIVFGYYIFFNLIQVFGQRGIVTPFVTAWLANVIALAIGLGLSIEAAK